MQASINYLANRSPLCTRLRDVLEGKNEKIESLTKALEDSSRREETLCTHVKDLEERISGLKAQIWSLEAKEALQCAVEGKAGEDVIQKTCEKRPESECQVTMPSTVPSESRLDATTRPQREQAAKLERKRKLQDTRSLNVDLEPPKRSEPKKSKSLADTATKDIKLYEGHEKEQAKVLESMDFGEHEALLLEKDLELTKLRNSTNVDKKLLEMKNDEIKRLTKQVESATREIERLGDTLRTVKNTSNSRDEAVKILCNLLKPGYGSFLESLEDGGPDFLKALPWPAHMVEALHGVDSQDRHNLSMLISIIGVFHNNLFDFKWQYKRKTADFQKRISDLVLKSQGLEKDLDNTKEAMTTQNKNQKQEINNQKAQNNRQKQEINKQTEEIDSKNVMLKDNEDTVAKQAEALKKEAINMKKLQQTIEELKNELANRPPTTGNNALLDEIVRGHEKELREAKELLAKQAPFVEIGVPVRNRLLEKCKELEHQDAELKELGNIAAHAVSLLLFKILLRMLLTFI